VVEHLSVCDHVGFFCAPGGTVVLFGSASIAEFPLIQARRSTRNILFYLKKESTVGRGDRKTHKGKLFKGSFGNSRPHHKGRKTKVAGQGSTAQAPPATRKKP
jgi:ribosomal small subunit protein bTHX